MSERPEARAAGYYDRLWAAAWQPVSDVSPLRASRERLILRELRGVLRPGCSLLDVGCGDGHLLGVLRARRPDLALRGIDFAREACLRAPASVRDVIAVGDIADLDAALPGERFDVAVSSEVLEHVTDPAAVVRSIASVLLPGGSFVVTVPGAMAYWSDLDASAGHVRRFEFDELRALLAENGFVVESVFGWGALVARAYYRLVRSIGAGGVAAAAQTGPAALLGRAVGEAMRLDDLLPRRGGFQLVARGRRR